MISYNLRKLIIFFCLNMQKISIYGYTSDIIIHGNAPSPAANIITYVCLEHKYYFTLSHCEINIAFKHQTENNNNLYVYINRIKLEIVVRLKYKAN